MKKHVLVIMTALFSFGAFGCSVPSSADVRSVDPPPRRVEDQSPMYQNVSTVNWGVSQDVQIEAKLERLNKPLSDAPTGLPLARLTVRNLSTSRIIYEQSSDDSPISMCARDINGDVGRALVVTWSGGSAERLEILSVNATQAQVLLNEAYRVDASLISLLGDSQLDVLITTGESGVGPFYTTRYVWDGRKYQRMGQVPYKSLKRMIVKQFTVRG